MPSDLRLAAGRGQLRLAFAPLVRARTRTVAGFVVHPCWAHPEAGLLAPAEVRPLAERLGVAGAVDAWAADRVGAVLATWDAEALGALALLAVAVGPETLADARAHRHLRAIADLSGLPPDRLRFVETTGDLGVLLRGRGLETTAPGSVSAEAAGALLGRARPVTRRVRAFACVRV